MRKLIAAAWILGSTVSAAALALFLFGCCVLPFHDVVHRAFPICGHIAGVLSHAHHDQPAPATPASVKRAPVPATIAARLPIRALDAAPLRVALLARSLRNIRSLGALRVDDDIGLHALFVTFLI
jgi:hypothetical protein